jgi:hypothetical protein
LIKGFETKRGKMDETKLALLVQLIENLRENYASLERAYNSADKEAFDKSKKALLEIQSKIKLLADKTQGL